MIPRILLDTAAIPGGGELRLFRRGDDFSIMLGANELMNSRLSGSEEALAELVCDRLGGRPAPRLLIGGLGMGFTLRAALARTGDDAEITVAELVPEVVAWACGAMAHLQGESLADPRVTIIADDVRTLIRDGRGRYDAILLDVDNGPDGITIEANDRLYHARGLTDARAALRPGGMLAIWSAAKSDPFARRLAEAGFAVEEIRVRARGGGRGAHHVIWIATRPG
jgi:spermidine synthase